MEKNLSAEPVEEGKAWTRSADGVKRTEEYYCLAGERRNTPFVIGERRLAFSKGGG